MSTTPGREANQTVSREELLAAYKFLTSDADATWFDLVEQGLMGSGVLLQPELLLDFDVDGSRTDLVEEFERRPLGPYSDDLQLLLWRLRARPGNARYALRRHGSGGWQIVRLVGKRRPTVEVVDDTVLETAEDCEWAVFALRWRDRTGRELPLRRPG
jgi:hypothetical protein